jgi:serine/threonine-protein kinase RIO1
MSFLDRFKPQPRWKHADAAVRAAGVDEIPADEESLATLRELASGDEDVRVRRAAAARLYRAADILPLARRERDESLRRELVERLVSIATEPSRDGSTKNETDGDAAVALEGIEDQRQLATVAQAAPLDAVRAAALARVQDVKALSSIARKAAYAGTALEAAQRIADRTELLNVAVKTDHKDAGVAALERAVESDKLDEASELRETLDMVATRAKNKSVSKRARAMMQALDEAEAARRLALEAWQQQVAGLVARVESISPAAEGAAQELERTEGEWAALATEPTFELDPDSVARFEAAAGRARTGIAEHERMEAERRAEDERRAALHASRALMIQQVDSIRGENALERIEDATRAWEALGAAEDDAAIGALRTQFESAVAAARQRHQNQLDMQQTHVRLSELAGEAERLSGEMTLAREAWTAATSEWAGLITRSEGLDETVSQRYEQAVARVTQRAEEQHAAEERSLRQQLQRIEQLIERAQKRSAAEDLTLREAERLSRDLRSAMEAPAPVEKEHQAALLERLKAAATAVAPRVHDLREMDEWKRFANAAVQEELIARAEALRARFGFDAPEGPKPDGAQPESPREEDLDKAARELHDIQERWKSVAEAPRAQAQALWHRYRQAADPIQARLREFFSHRNEERKGNLEKKLALIARAEALADSTDWIKTADELKKLQAEWQQVGPVPRQETRATWKQFREACDRFFTRRNADLAERKETWTANLTRKEALCARAEELATSREWDKAAAEIRRLQADWKTVGPVRRNKSEAVWQRFRAACDTFFDRYKRRDEIELESKQADREQLVAELEALSPAEDTINGTDASGLLEQVRSLRNRWNASTPVVRHGADPLSARFVSALERALTSHPDAFKGTELDIEPNRQKMEKLVARVEGFMTDAAPAPANSSQALADMLREALASNTIGGRAGEESKWRTMAEDVRQAQAAWSRLGPVPGETGRALNERFHRAVTRFFDQYRRKVPPQQQSSHRDRKPVGTR